MVDEMRDARVRDDASARASVPSTDGRSDGRAARWWCRIPMERKSIRGRAYLGDRGGGGGGANRRPAARGDVDAPRADAARRRVRREDARSERGVRRRHRCGQPKVKPRLAGAGIGSLRLARLLSAPVIRTRSRQMCDRSFAFHVAPERDSCHGPSPKEKNRADWLPYDSASRTRACGPGGLLTRAKDGVRCETRRWSLARRAAASPVLREQSPREVCPAYRAPRFRPRRFRTLARRPSLARRVASDPLA